MSKIHKEKIYVCTKHNEDAIIESTQDDDIGFYKSMVLDASKTSDNDVVENDIIKRALIKIFSIKYGLSTLYRVDELQDGQKYRELNREDEEKPEIDVSIEFNNMFSNMGSELYPAPVLSEMYIEKDADVTKTPFSTYITNSNTVLLFDVDKFQDMVDTKRVKPYDLLRSLKKEILLAYSSAVGFNSITNNRGYVRMLNTYATSG